MKLYTYIAVLLLYCLNTLFSGEISTASPDGAVIIAFKLNEEGIPQYRISYGGQVFVNWSNLGLNFKESGYIGSDLKLISSGQKVIDETFKIVAGKSAYSRNFCSETKIILEEKSGQKRKLELYFRAYNDGAAFRYGIPGQSFPGAIALSSEETHFNFAGNYDCWAVTTNSFSFNYEGDYRKTNLSGIVNKNNANSMIALPVTLKAARNLFVCLSEANITDYAGMYLIKTGAASFKSKLSPLPNDNSIAAKITPPFFTPWRMFIIGSEPGDLIESNLIMNLNNPQSFDASWVKPGKSVWDWLSPGSGFDAGFGWGMNDKTFKYYIDFAAQNNIEYVTVDAGWYGTVNSGRNDQVNDITKSIKELNIEELVKYGNSKGVGIIVWVLWSQLRDQMDKALDHYSAIGIKGIKIDFMNRDDQEMVNFYHDVLKKAAEHKLIINFHGAYKPDGLNRTYPNLITREAVLGAEYYKWDKHYPNPNYNVTIPFTRMLIGAMDYTPGGMRNTKPGDETVSWTSPVARGTRAHSLASLVIFESPLQTLGESPAVYQNSAGFDFIKQCPASWDSTLVLSGSIGEFIVIARKSGENWFVGAMTNRESREVTINFSFLNGIRYDCEVFADPEESDVNPQNLKIIKTEIRHGFKNIYRLAQGGGLALILKKK
jgi:alpha-glucosidase